MSEVEISYKVNEPISEAQFISLLKETSLGDRRPIAEQDRIADMLKHSNLLVTAWSGDKLVGVARSLTDFSFCCYLSDLAVSETVQKAGLGKKLISVTAAQLHPKCRVILLAAPLAVEYYPKIGFEQHPSAWTLLADQF
ncbi:GNAT family N-acetyltransferase [Erwinia sp.]|uniref:GNAT family N-acetyltransferase n=1 Tax=Erwinia citreus TaxID=558 RepID=UPI003C723BCB